MSISVKQSKNSRLMIDVHVKEKAESTTRFFQGNNERGAFVILTIGDEVHLFFSDVESLNNLINAAEDLLKELKDGAQIPIKWPEQELTK